MKTEVYSWRVSPQRKAELEGEARREGTSLAKLLDDITANWLEEQRNSRQGDQADPDQAPTAWALSRARLWSRRPVRRRRRRGGGWRLIDSQIPGLGFDGRLRLALSLDRGPHTLPHFFGQQRC